MIYKTIEIRHAAIGSGIYINIYQMDDVDREYIPEEDDRPNNTFFWHFPSEKYTDEEAKKIMIDYFVSEKRKDIELLERMIEMVKNAPSMEEYYRKLKEEENGMQAKSQ